MHEVEGTSYFEITARLRAGVKGKRSARRRSEEGHSSCEGCSESTKITTAPPLPMGCDMRPMHPVLPSSVWATLSSLLVIIRQRMVSWHALSAQVRRSSAPLCIGQESQRVCNATASMPYWMDCDNASKAWSPIVVSRDRDPSCHTTSPSSFLPMKTVQPRRCLLIPFPIHFIIWPPVPVIPRRRLPSQRVL